ncbi:hypothetical protein AVEN_266202-1 [Araneus ventricosus]|uniref:Uncharacterized protein n=1 Tax=Araneus ventricosus TaxID=182803 RepID=A0A4Y2APJ0_ARAVE|nr:hypothetical protein AVEN_266202-1 [Araneus ventricosus]
MRTGSNLCAPESFGANYVTLSLSRQEWKIGTHLFEFDSLPRYFSIAIIYNEKPSDSHWILGYSRFEFFSHTEGGETAPFWGSIRESLGENTPAGVSYKWPRWPSGKVSALGPEGSRFETRFH